jgi:hypothetical protein
MERERRRNTLNNLSKQSELSPWLQYELGEEINNKIEPNIKIDTLEFHPHVGLSPFKFNMLPKNIIELAGKSPHRGISRDLKHPFDMYSNFRVGYSLDLLAQEFTVWPGSSLKILFKNEILFSPNCTTSPLKMFLNEDPSPRVIFGSIIFNSIGVLVTGYHDNDSEQKTITFCQTGHLDDLYSEATDIDLSQYRKS